MTPQLLEERLIEFAVAIVGVVESLPGSKAGNHIASHLIRSGTSSAPITPGREARNPERISYTR